MQSKERKKLFRIYDKKHKRYITSPDTACINHYGELQRAFGFTGEPTLAPDAPAVPDGWGLTVGGNLTIVGNIHKFK